MDPIRALPNQQVNELLRKNTLFELSKQKLFQPEKIAYQPANGAAERNEGVSSNDLTPATCQQILTQRTTETI